MADVLVLAGDSSCRRSIRVVEELGQANPITLKLAELSSEPSIEK
ncbi:MAG: hypothetical protein AB7G23_10575 [Vicinamibacterales bacterium]